MSPDEHIIDALIFGSNSKHTQTKLLEKDATLNLDTALDIAALKRGQAPSNATNSPSKPCGPIIRLCGCCG